MNSREHDEKLTPPSGVNCTDSELNEWLAPLQATYQRTDAEQFTPRDAGELRARRSHQIHGIAALIRKVPEQKKRDTQRRTWAWLAAAAGVFALVCGAAVSGFGPTAQMGAQVNTHTALVSDGASLRQVIGRVVATRADRGPEVVSDSTSFAAGDEVSTTAEAFASLDVGRSRVDLASASTLRLLRVHKLDQVFQLEAGRVDLSIPRVPGETRSVVIKTADALVSVKGTVFSVEVVHEDEHPITLVQVTRGVVAVEAHGQTHLVHAGESWSTSQREAAPQTPENEPATQVQGNTSADGALSPSKQDPPTPRAKASGATAESVRSSSHLGEQNQLFARALAAREHGDDARAQALFDELLRRFPNSPLRASAATERAAASKRLQEP